MEDRKYGVRHISDYEIYAASPDEAFTEASSPLVTPNQEEWIITLKEDDDK